MNVKIKLLTDNAKIPTQAYDDAAAWDIYATGITEVNHEEHGYVQYNTGIALEIPSGYVVKIYPRSSISDTGMILANAVPIIDPDYRDEILLRYKWIPGTRKYKVGERIAQLRLEKTIPIKWVLTDTLSETTRNEGAFGSSGK